MSFAKSVRDLPVLSSLCSSNGLCGIAVFSNDDVHLDQAAQCMKCVMIDHFRGYGVRSVDVRQRAFPSGRGGMLYASMDVVKKDAKALLQKHRFVTLDVSRATKRANAKKSVVISMMLEFAGAHNRRYSNDPHYNVVAKGFHVEPGKDVALSFATVFTYLNTNVAPIFSIVKDSSRDDELVIKFESASDALRALEEFSSRSVDVPITFQNGHQYLMDLKLSGMRKKGVPSESPRTRRTSSAAPVPKSETLEDPKRAVVHKKEEYYIECLVYDVVNFVLGAEDQQSVPKNLCQMCGNNEARFVSKPCMHHSTCDVCHYIYSALHMQCTICGCTCESNLDPFSVTDAP